MGEVRSTEYMKHLPSHVIMSNHGAPQPCENPKLESAIQKIARLCFSHDRHP